MEKQLQVQSVYFYNEWRKPPGLSSICIIVAFTVFAKRLLHSLTFLEVYHFMASLNSATLADKM